MFFDGYSTINIIFFEKVNLFKYFYLCSSEGLSVLIQDYAKITRLHKCYKLENLCANTRLLPTPFLAVLQLHVDKYIPKVKDIITLNTSR